MPVNVTPNGSAEAKIGWWSSGVTLNYTNKNVVEWRSGKLRVSNFYGNCLDYAPYTKIKAYLPFVGEIDLNPDEVTGQDVEIVYNIDLLSGGCVAQILVNDSVRYHADGMMGYIVPLSEVSFDALFRTIAAGVTAVGVGMVAGPNAGVSAGSMVAAAGGTSATETIAPGASSQTIKTVGNALSAATSQIASKPAYVKTGNVSSNKGFLSTKTPYLTITRQIQNIPENYGKLYGYPANITETIGNLKGFTIVDSIHLEGLGTATKTEKELIENALKIGVIL